MMSELAGKIAEYNAPYEEKTANEGRRSFRKNYKLILNSSPVLLSAPHAVKQFRNGEKKGKDINTGGIVEYLCESAGCCGIIRTFNKFDDPNYSPDKVSERYREEIRSFVRTSHCPLLLDIHGCADTRSYDIYIGTNHGKNIQGRIDLARQLADLLRKSGASVVIDEKLCASREYNICRETASQTQIPCMQIEIRNEWRTQPKYLEKLIPALESFIRSFSEG